MIKELTTACHGKKELMERRSVPENSPSRLYKHSLQDERLTEPLYLATAANAEGESWPSRFPHKPPE